LVKENFDQENLVKVMCCHYLSFSDDWSKKRQKHMVKTAGKAEHVGWDPKLKKIGKMTGVKK
jgi:hypothetical protein